MRTEIPSLAAAVLLHAALLGARFFLHAPALDATQPGAELRTIDIESIEIPRTPPSPQAPREPSAAAAQPPSNLDPRVARAEPAAGSRDPVVAPPVAPGLEPTANPSAPPGRAPDHYDALPDDGRGGGIIGVPGLNGGPLWAMPGVMPNAPTPTAAPTEAPRPRPVDKDVAGNVIRDALQKNDKQLGLDLPGAGSVASAVGAAVNGSDAPDVSRATFEVRLGPDGKVLGVRVSSFNGGTADVWNQAAQAAAALLRSRTLRMNEAFAKGGTVYVDVSSVIQLPSGSTSAIRPSGLGASFDLSDIGAHTRRLVKTSFRTVASR